MGSAPPRRSLPDRPHLVGPSRCSRAPGTPRGPDSPPLPGRVWGLEADSRQGNPPLPDYNCICFFLRVM
jgi:hypothetical protein